MNKEQDTTKQIEQPSSNGYGVAALVLGIVSLTGLGLLAGIPAIVLGVIALNKKQSDRGLSIAGIIMGAISTLLSLLFIIFIIAVIIFGISAQPTDYIDSQFEDNQWLQSTQT